MHITPLIFGVGCIWDKALKYCVYADILPQIELTFNVLKKIKNLLLIRFVFGRELKRLNEMIKLFRFPA